FFFKIIKSIIKKPLKNQRLIVIFLNNIVPRIRLRRAGWIHAAVPFTPARGVPKGLCRYRDRSFSLV
ncbi:MAG: hypothetical protein ACKO5C_00230, partial [Ferruginibacter sp.]